ncbi:MAG: hypothetical protein ACPGSB_00155 [Opitutales bacterium]
MHSIKLPYGHRDGALHYVGVVPAGLECACVCPKCGGKLIARKGTERAKHFAHVDVLDCEGAAEHALREKLVELIAAMKFVELPQSTEYMHGERREVVPEERAEIEEVSLEDGENAHQPRFRVKLKNTDSGENSVSFVVNLGKKDVETPEPNDTVAEINLSDLGIDFSEERLRNAISGQTKCLRWVHRPRAYKASEELREKLRYERIRTSPEEADYLMKRARVPSFEGRASETSWISPDVTIGHSPPDAARPAVIHPLASVVFSCEKCGREGLTIDDMQRCIPDKGTGVCYECVRAKR